MEKFIIKLDESILRRFDEVINNNGKFFIKHSHDRKNKNERSWNIICAIKDRIADITKYLNNLMLNENNYGNAFDFLNFLNHSAVLIDCIYTLLNVINLNIESIKDPSSIFKKDIIINEGCEDKHKDDNYFKYLRSLSSVHPIETSRHKVYQKYDFEVSPFIVWHSKLPHYNGDLILIIYNQDGDDYVRYIYIDEIFEYVNSRFEIINLIINEMEKHAENKINNFRKEKIKDIVDFDNYVDYMHNLKDEYKNRISEENLGDFDYVINAIKQKITTESNKPKVELYIKALKYSITFLHKQVQDLPKNLTEEKYTGIKYPNKNRELGLFDELNMIDNKNYDDYTLSKSYTLICDNYDFIYRNENRKLVLMLPIFNDVGIIINENESNFELYLLLKTALYIKSFEFDNVLSRNIPKKFKPSNI